MPILPINLPPGLPDTRQLTLFRAEAPAIDPGEVTTLARRLGVRTEIEELSGRLVCRDEDSMLEVFAASGAIRWARFLPGPEDSGGPPIPAEEARRLGERFLADNGLLDEGMSVASTSTSDIIRIEESDGVRPVTTPVAVHVNFSFTLDGIPVRGPGAKAQVTFGSTGEPIGFYHFWRKVRPDESVNLIGVSAAAQLMQLDSAFAQLPLLGPVLTVHSVELTYLAAPPRETQRLLAPVYAFVSTLSTPALPRYDFVHNVLAVPRALDRLKDIANSGWVTSMVS